MYFIDRSDGLKNSSQSLSGTQSSTSGTLAASCTPTEIEGRRRPVICYNCNGLGHIAKHCTTTQRSWDKFRLDRPRRERSDSTGLDEKCQSKMATAVQTLLSKKSHSYCYGNNRPWGNAIVDSTTFEHKVRNLKYLWKVVKVPSMHVVLVNGTNATVTHKGQARIDTGSDKTISTTVYLVSSLKFNLTSCSRLDEYGVTTTISDILCTQIDRDDRNWVLGKMWKHSRIDCS